MISCLLVTADPVARDILRVGLEQTGFEVDTAEDAWAVELARTRNYRVVIADGPLADGTDGLQALRLLREVAPDAEMLLVTRNRNYGRQIARDKQQIGLWGLIYLPVDPTEFFGTVARLLERLGAPAAA